jgi:hypothetical protein
VFVMAATTRKMQPEIAAFIADQIMALWNQASDERSDWSMRFPADGGKVIDEAVSRSPACSLLLPRGQRLSYHHQHGTAAGGQALLQVGQL